MMDVEERPTVRWAVLGLAALAVDSLLLAIHRLHVLADRVGPAGGWPVPSEVSRGWAGTGDGSLIELWGQLQLVAAAVLLIHLALRASGRRVLAAWGVVLLTMAADDGLRLHERAGRRLNLGQVIPALPDRAAQEVGGLVYWAVVGFVLGAGLLWAYVTSTSAARRAARILLVSAVPLAAVAAAYVLLSAVDREFLSGLSGVVVVDVRVTVKLLTTTAFVVVALWLRERRP